MCVFVSIRGKSYRCLSERLTSSSDTLTDAGAACRIVQLEAGGVEDFIDYLVGAGRIDEAASRLAQAINDDGWGVRVQGVGPDSRGMLGLCKVTVSTDAPPVGDSCGGEGAA